MNFINQVQASLYLSFMFWNCFGSTANQNDHNLVIYTCSLISAGKSPVTANDIMTLKHTQRKPASSAWQWYGQLVQQFTPLKLSCNWRVCLLTCSISCCLLTGQKCPNWLGSLKLIFKKHSSIKGYSRWLTPRHSFTQQNYSPKVDTRIHPVTHVESIQKQSAREKSAYITNAESEELLGTSFQSR